jgi:hypothetical protein
MEFGATSWWHYAASILAGRMAEHPRWNLERLLGGRLGGTNRPQKKGLCVLVGAALAAVVWGLTLGGNWLLLMGLAW